MKISGRYPWNISNNKLATVNVLLGRKFRGMIYEVCARGKEAREERVDGWEGRTRCRGTGRIEVRRKRSRKNSKSLRD